MNAIAKTLARVYSALEFANVGNLRSLKETLDRHESNNASPNSCGTQEGQDARGCNVFYLNPSLPAR